MFRKALWASAIALVLACSSAPPEMTLVPDSDNAKADGKDSILITATVTKGGAEATRGTVAFTLDTDGASFAIITDPSKPPSADSAKKQVNVAGGKAEVRVYSVTATNVGVTALYSDTVAKTSASATVSVKFTGTAVPVSSFEYISATPPQVPLGGSSKVKFKALNSAGNPVATLPVTFSVAPPGTATVETTGETIADGTVTTTLTAGNIAGTVTVTVMAANDETVRKTSDAIAISGGGINAKNLSLVCPHYSIGGFQKFGLEMECAAYASDYSGAFVPNSRVIFMTEAGGVPASVPFSADPAKGGVAKLMYRTQCQEPRDVPPLGDTAGDPGNPCVVMNQCKASPTPEARTCNPRDAWATLVAISTGGESFQDGNGNLKWDPGESFIDLPEPFVDANDNGTRDNDPANDNVEDFYDADNDGQWDDKNGVWDAYTAVWTSVKITWTGEPTELVLMPGNDSGTGAGGYSPHCTSIHYAGYVKDARGNPPTAASATADKVKATCTFNCKVGKIGLYDDSEGLIDVTVSDAHGCPAPCNAPGCVPGGFTVDFSLARTLDARATSKVEDDLNKVIMTDPAPRSGGFE